MATLLPVGSPLPLMNTAVLSLVTGPLKSWKRHAHSPSSHIVGLEAMLFWCAVWGAVAALAFFVLERIVHDPDDETLGGRSGYDDDSDD